MRIHELLLVSLLATACATGTPPGAQPEPDRFAAQLNQRDPIGFLLENRDSLRIDDAVRERLVRLNLRLYARIRPLDAVIDTLLPPPRPGSATQPPQAGGPADSLLGERARLVAAARDTAWSWLSDEQRSSAERLAARPGRRAGPRGR